MLSSAPSARGSLLSIIMNASGFFSALYISDYVCENVVDFLIRIAVIRKANHANLPYDSPLISDNFFVERNITYRGIFLFSVEEPVIFESGQKTLPITNRMPT